MTSLPETHKELLERHLSPDEHPMDFHAGNDETYLVTDQRLLIAGTGKHEGRDVERTEAIRLDQVSSISIEVVREEPTKIETLLGAGILVVIGLVGVFFGSSELQGTLGLVFTVGGLAALLGAVVVAISSSQDNPGHVKISLTTASEQSNRSYKLPTSAAEFAASISKATGTVETEPSGSETAKAAEVSKT